MLEMGRRASRKEGRGSGWPDLCRGERPKHGGRSRGRECTGGPCQKSTASGVPWAEEGEQVRRAGRPKHGGRSRGEGPGCRGQNTGKCRVTSRREKTPSNWNV